MSAQEERAANSGATNATANWTPEADALLRSSVLKFDGKQWRAIASDAFGDTRTDVQCMHRWQKVLKPGLVKGTWTPEEDEMVLSMVQQHGLKKWSAVASSIPGRLGKQCRERYFNYLDPTISHAEWSAAEEAILTQAHAELGSKWAAISKRLPGRTENAIKNHFNGIAKKKKREAHMTGGGDAAAAAFMGINTQMAGKITHTHAAASAAAASSSATPPSATPVRATALVPALASSLALAPASPAAAAAAASLPLHGASTPSPLSAPAHPLPAFVSPARAPLSMSVLPYSGIPLPQLPPTPHHAPSAIPFNTAALNMPLPLLRNFVPSAAPPLSALIIRRTPSTVPTNGPPPNRRSIKVGPRVTAAAAVIAAATASTEPPTPVASARPLAPVTIPATLAEPNYTLAPLHTPPASLETALADSAWLLQPSLPFHEPPPLLPDALVPAPGAGLVLDPDADGFPSERWLHEVAAVAAANEALVQEEERWIAAQKDAFDALEAPRTPVKSARPLLHSPYHPASMSAASVARGGVGGGAGGYTNTPVSSADKRVIVSSFLTSPYTSPSTSPSRGGRGAGGYSVKRGHAATATVTAAAAAATSTPVSDIKQEGVQSKRARLDTDPSTPAASAAVGPTVPAACSSCGSALPASSASLTPASALSHMSLLTPSQYRHCATRESHLRQLQSPSPLGPHVRHPRSLSGALAASLLATPDVFDDSPMEQENRVADAPVPPAASSSAATHALFAPLTPSRGAVIERDPMNVIAQEHICNVINAEQQRKAQHTQHERAEVRKRLQKH